MWLTDRERGVRLSHAPPTNFSHVELLHYDGVEPICRVRNNSYKLGSIIRPPPTQPKTGRELGEGGMCYTLPDSILRRREHAISELEITNGLGDRYEPIIFLFIFPKLFTFTLKLLLHCAQCVVRGFQLKAKFPLWYHRRN